MTISQKLVAAMGGAIAVTSAVGAGSEFSFECAFQIDGDLRFADAPADGARRAIQILVREGPTRQCLERYVRDAGMTPLAGSELAEAPVDQHEVRGIFAEASALAAESGLIRRPNCPIVVVSEFGDATADLLVNEGRADVTVDRPLSPKVIRSLLAELSREGARLSEANRSDGRAPAQATSFRGTHVLAADDSAVNREVLIEALARLDVQVTSVNDGQQAIDAARARRFDLIFMDGSMPNVDGFEAAQAIRAMEAEMGRPRVPIIALTAHVLGEQAMRWRDAGMCDHISKPFALKTIQACLERWVGKPVMRESQPDAHLTSEADRNSALMDDSVLAQIAEMQAPGDDLVYRILGLYLEHAPHALNRLAALVGRSRHALGRRGRARLEISKSQCRRIARWRSMWRG